MKYKNLFNQIKESHYTLEEFARLIGLDISELQLKLAGILDFNLRELERIQALLPRSIDYLLHEF